MRGGFDCKGPGERDGSAKEGGLGSGFSTMLVVGGGSGSMFVPQLGWLNPSLRAAAGEMSITEGGRLFTLGESLAISTLVDVLISTRERITPGSEAAFAWSPCAVRVILDMVNPSELSPLIRFLGRHSR